MNIWLHFGGDQGHRLDYIVFRIHHYREIREMVNEHKSAHTGSRDGGTGKTYLGGGMHCPSVSAYYCRCRCHCCCSVIAEIPRDALSQFKSCHLLHNCTKNRI